MTYFLDTSAILNGALKEYQDVCVSTTVLAELENIKTNFSKSDELKYLAREAVRDIIFNKDNNIKIYLPAEKRVQKFINKNNYLKDIPDHHILVESYFYQKEIKEQVILLTSDGTMTLFARVLPIVTAYYIPKEKNKQEEYCGWRRFTPTEEELISLYSSPTINILNLKINEFAEIFENEELKDILFWDGNKYSALKYHNIKNPYTGEIIKPRNIEQKMAFHILQNPNIKIKLLTARWGSGKTLLALNYALEQISKGNYDKLVFVRNNIIAAGTNDIGYLPGDVRDKLSIFARCIADHVGGEEELDRLMDEGIIETVPLSHIRGRSIKNSIVLCDECENMDDKLTTLLMSRIEENSELIFCGDVAQIDKKIFDEHNGIRSMLKNLAGDPLFGAVKLVKSERSKVAALCDKMIPPK